jgi:hypothetical protein
MMLTVMLGKVYRNVLEERNVQAVEPDDVGLSLVAMVMPVPYRSYDQVARLHEHFLSRYGGVT